jgi:hypothetical protein
MEGDVNQPLEQFLENYHKGINKDARIAQLEEDINKDYMKICKLYVDALVKLFKSSPLYAKGEKHFEVKMNEMQSGKYPSKIILAMEQDNLLDRDILHIRQEYDGKRSEGG